MVVWLLGVGLIGLVIWAFWHERNLRQQQTERQQQDEILLAQRQQLAQQLLNTRALERGEAGQAALARLESGDLEAFDSLEALIRQSPEAEQWQWLDALCELLVRRYGAQPLSAPFDAGLLRLFQLLSARPQGYAQVDGVRRCLRLQNLQFQGLVCQDLNLRGAELSDCRLPESRLPGLDLFAARLTAVNLSRAGLSGIKLTGASLNHVDFEGADLRGAELISAQLHDCSLRAADLRQAACRGVRLGSCDLRGANLDGASGLSFELLQHCRLDQATRLPEALQARQAELIARSRA